MVCHFQVIIKIIAREMNDISLSVLCNLEFYRMFCYKNTVIIEII